MEDNKTKSPVIADTNKPNTDTPTQNKTGFTNFTGEYSRSSGLVTLNWILNDNGIGVSSVKLYHTTKTEEQEKDNFMADVHDTSNYSMPQNVYGFPTGVNTFKIKAVLIDGSSVEATTSINVSLILSTNQSVTVNEKTQSADITLTYVYGKNNPVAVPTILILDSNAFLNENISLKGTTTQANGDFIEAKTTYHFVWQGELAPEAFTLRWYFTEIERGYDFAVDLAKAE